MPAFDVIFGFDMETDVGSWTPYYEGLKHGTPRILKVLEKHGATGTFFFTGEAARKDPKVLRAVARAGHEVGCHSIHHETLGDEIFPIPGVRAVLPEEVPRRIEIATDMVADAAGRRPVSFRCPRLWGSTAVVNALDNLGYRADASYPLYFYEKRLAPYHPAKQDWTTEGRLRIVEIPNFADMTIRSRDPHGRDRDQWPLFRTKSAAALMRHVDNMLALWTRKKLPAVVCLYMHPWEFHDMPQGWISYGEGSVRPYPMLVKNCGAYAVKEFDRLIALFTSRGARFRTAGQLAQEWSKRQNPT